MTKQRFVLLFGSETGQCKSIAQGVVDVAHEQQDLCIDLFELDDVDKQFKLEEEPVIVIITSSTGDGEPPSNASKFWRKIRREKNPKYLSHMKYTVLGLGDTNYSNFCNCGKVLDRRFEELGATRFYPSNWADDAVGLEKTVEPWLEGLWPEIKKILPSITDDNPILSKENIGEKLEKSETTSTKDSLETSMKQLALKECSTNTSFVQHSTLSKEPKTEDNLKYSSLIANQTLTLPPKPAYSLCVQLVEPKEEEEACKNSFSTDAYVFCSKLVKRECLTHEEALKSVMFIELELIQQFDYQPGDSIKIVCENDEYEVDMLLKRLGWTSMANNLVHIIISPDNTKKSAKLPSHIPDLCTLKYAFLHCIDIRSCLRKNILRLLVEFTSDCDERRRLEELCSKEGSDDYIKYMLDTNLSLLDVLNHFKTCQPDLQTLIEFLPPLISRFYSICNSPLHDIPHIYFVYSLFNFDIKDGRTYDRHGVCTSWLSNLSIGSNISIQNRINQNFRLPSSLDIPLIMIGPGTGVAPFIGFLQHIDQIKTYQHANILKYLFVAASREEDYEYRYVQDHIRANGKELSRLIYDCHALIYVCGDIKQMSRDVRNTIGQILKEHSDIENIDDYMKTLDTSQRYLQDIWS
ncbi:unnamed protein product [Didymodactylos carnosus]|uniref:Methionine synthase reductase n=1 Tax=Didymodactylos carnosus TaxID=1234261 RepID=A0A814LBF9_9BILA|nr:unnamed protein product [Didymodactylos carnosus]CAF1201314.1 unnamed protein product [Didymodactylos carnosus]CAF3830558.1 unnamed protein product [Didymodactylos carnosus]CAF4011193.1 unnamed protein product [Didymodactylos carnosus]